MDQRVKAYLYPNAPKQDGLCQEFTNVQPLYDVDNHPLCIRVDNPQDADLFVMGQLTDRVPNALHPGDFIYLRGRESRHVLDVDGDWAGMQMPAWLADVTLTARNVLKTEYYENWIVYPTPGSSMLTIDLLKNPREYKPPIWHGAYFRGRMDWQEGFRPKLFRALQMSGIPNSFNVMQYSYMFPADGKLGPYTLDGLKENMQRFEMEMLNWSMSLCPRAGSHYTQRFYESCALGRLPIVFGDNYWLDDEAAPSIKIKWDIDERDIANALIQTYNSLTLEDTIKMGQMARKYWDDHVVPYFEDPTRQFIIWAREQGIVT